MSSTTIPCAQGVSVAMLAAWRDGGLSEREAERLHTHVADCAACRAQLTTADRLDAALRAQPVPTPDERLWRGVRDGIAHPQWHTRGGANRSGRRMTRRALISSIAAVAAIALITVGFARVFQLRQLTTHPRDVHATATPATNVTAVPEQTQAVTGTPLTWQGATLPPGVSSDPTQGILTIALANTDGNTAYTCSAAGIPNPPIQIRVTHDRAVTWTLAGRLPSIGSVSDCALQVDRSDAQRLTANVLGTNLTTNSSLSLTYLSNDGGGSWALVSNTYSLADLTTVGARVFAIQFSSAPSGSSTGSVRLVTSQDDGHTWRPIDQSLVPFGDVDSFWVTADRNNLLAEVRHADIKQPATLWQSTDVGAHWTQVAAPVAGLGNVFIVQEPSVGQPWRICDEADHPLASGPQMSLFCTQDGGATWQARPGLSLTAICSNCPDGSESALVSSLTLTRQGDLLASDLYGPTKNGVIQQVTGWGLYRLDSGASQWASLGPIPGSAFFYVGAPRTEVLWGLVAGVYGSMTLSANVGGNQNSPRQIGTATYP